MLKLLFPISDFLYILQLEEYETKRYFKTIKRIFWKRNLQKRGKLVYTKRIKILYLISLPLCIILFPFIPLIIGITNMILTPYFEWVKSNLQKRAARYFRAHNTITKVVAVAGSYGKTTTKNYIYELVKYNYKTQIVPGNINTPTGIANWVLNNFNPSSEILIIEVDTYYIGEIKKSLLITPPDIAILTNIGDQHLERFGTKSNLRKALLEIFDYSKPTATKIQGDKSNLDFALEVSKILNIPKDIVNDTVKKLSKPDRRGDIKFINNYEVIDESYNISFETAKFAIQNALKIAEQKNKKLIVITAGIPELGRENADNNKKLGQLLAQKANKIILIKSILYTQVQNNSEKIILAENLSEAWKLIKKFDPKKYIVLLQPELNDLYY
jgi:UDP-N-acetylmuramyl pentapeptide synthase